MANNEWGDSPVLTAPPQNEWGDAPASPSVYSEIIAEQDAFNRRAALNTPEAIGRRATLDEDSIVRRTPIPSGLGFDVPLSIAQPLIENAPRIGVPLGAALSLTGVGALPGAGIMALSGLAGEVGSEALEKEFGSRDSFSLPQIATNTLLSAAPPLRLAGVASPIVRGGLRAAEGAGYGALAPTLEAGFRGELPTAEELRTGALFGGILGAPFGAAELANSRRAAIQRIEAAPTLEGKLQIIDQEVKLAGDTLTPAEQRGALDMKQQLEAQVDRQKAVEQQAKEVERAAKEQQRLFADAQKAQQEAMQPPEVPKSAQILAEPTAKPPSIANVATEIATQTESSPFALQNKLNELTAAPAQQIASPSQAGEIVSPVEQAAPVPQTKAQAIKAAVADPETVWQYTVFRPGEGYPSAIQVDAIIPGEGAARNSVSSNPADLRKAGAKIPDVPEWVPQGQYSREQIEQFIKEGEPKTAPVAPLASDPERTAKVARIKELNAAAKILGDKGGLTRDEAVRFRALMSEANDLRFDVTKPLALDKIPSPSERQSTLPSEIVLTARNDLYRNKSVYTPIIDAAVGVSHNADTAVDAVMLGLNPAVTPQQLYDAFSATREAMRGHYGDTIKLYRAGGAQKAKPTTNWATTREFAKNFGDKIEVREVPVDDIIAVNVGPTGKYHEVIVGERPVLPDATPVPTPRTAEQRLNDAGVDLPPVATMSRAEKRAELDAAGVATYNGKPLDEINPAELSAAVGKVRRGQPLETGQPEVATQAASRIRQQRGAVSPSVLAPLGGGAVGGAVGYAETDRLPGESDEAYNARRFQNAVIGGAAGAAAGSIVPLLSRGARVANERARTKRSGQVDLPTPGEGQGIRQTAEKVVENRAYPQQLRQVLADDPEILYSKISQKRIQELTQGATDAELVEMLASPDPNVRIGALIQQANRAAVTPGMEAEGARLYREVSKNFTSPAQFLGMAKLVESPQAMVDSVMDTLRDSVPRGTKVPTMTPQVQTHLFDLATNNIRAEQRFSAAERAARDNFNPTTKAEYLSARQSVGATRKALADYTKDILPERYGEIVSKIIKGNLLAPLSFAKNAFGNAAWQALLRGSETIATGLDAVYSQATGRPRKMALGNPLPGKEELEAFGQGVKIAGQELLTGPGTESYIKSEVQRGFHPVRAMLQVFSGVPAAERLMERRGIASLPTDAGASARVKKFIEATLGITPEASFRLLNMGDKPVRMAVEQRILSEQANLRGLRGTEREKFMLLPDTATQGLVEQEGLGGVLAQENKLALKVGKIFDTGLVDLAEAMRLGRSPILEDINKIAGTLAIPYRQFPANFALTAANFALPPVAFARATLQARSGNRREALRNMGEGVLGSMFLGAAGYLWDKGLISEPADPRDKKRRSAQYETMGAQRLNLSGLERLRNGGDPTYKRGDDTRDWSTIGPAAASFYVFTKAKSKDLNKAARTGDPAEDRSDLEVLLNVTDAAGFAFDQSFLSGTSAFIDALQDWDNYGDRFIQNTFRAITSTVAPNSLEALARADYKFIPEQKGDSLHETLKNVWDYKTMQLDQNERSNYKRDFWGNPITRTQAGQNPYIAQFIDVTKAETKQPDPFKQSLLELYQQTRSTDVYPALVTNRLAVNGTTVELTPSDYDDLQDFVGQAREDYAKRIVSDPRFNAPSIIPEQKILALNAAYSEGAKLGKAMLMKSAGFAERYPELFGQPTPKGHESRVISRDTKARGVLRTQRNEWGDTPVGP